MSLYLQMIKNPLVATISNHIDGYPTPINLSYLWGFGSLAGMALVIQIITGMLLAMHYAPEIHLAFTSVEHIMRDVRGGVALRYIHANGASMFFIVVYAHMFRGLYYGSYFQPRANLWYSGIVIFLLMMATAFMGYVLPWGQMSFWGATVITNLFSAIPGIGNSIVQLLWGGFSVDNPTLNRFFSLHYFVPFIIAGTAFLHLILLHQTGSNNPLGISSILDRVPFYPYFYVKDLFGFFIFVWIFSLFVIYAPNFLGHPDNYIEANPLVTPAHIVPEWYFLPFYAILRTIPDKLGGVLLMVFAIVILALLPVVDTSSFRSTFFKPLNIWFFWYFLSDSFSLGWIGQEIVESPFIEMANFVTFSYFAYFILFLPWAGFLENAVISHELRYASIFPFLLVNFSFSIIEDNIFWNFFFSGLPLFQVIIVVLFIFFLAIFFVKGSKFTQFMHRVAYAYFFFIFFVLTLDTVLRSNIWVENLNMISNFKISTLIQSFQGNSIFFNLFFLYSLFILIFFFYGIIDRFFIATSSDIEFFLIVLFIYLGALSVFCVHTFVDLILGLEVVTLASYILVAFERKNRFSTYGGIQYFILGSIPSGMLILGGAFLYKNWGTLALENLDLLLTNPFVSIDLYLNNIYFFLVDLNFSQNIFVENLSKNEIENIYWSLLEFQNLSENVNKSWENVIMESSPLTLTTILAIVLIFFNLFFKITAAPFHFWAPSVYSKTPIASVTFLSIFLKGMVFFLIFKVIFTFFYSFSLVLAPLFIFSGVFSVFFGIIGAFVEKIIKRFFVYSSMGHVGFMLIGLVFFSLEGISATFHYLFVYILSSFVMWFILLSLGRSANHLIFFKGLKHSNFLIAFIFALLIFSMSGIPPLGGFFVKFDILVAIMNNSNFYLSYILLIFTVVSFFYYLRVIKIIFFDNEEEFIKISTKSTERFWLIILLFLILFFYIILIQKPFLFIQNEALSTVF